MTMRYPRSPNAWNDRGHPLLHGHMFVSIHRTFWSSLDVHDLFRHPLDYVMIL